jgi:hypothetical protein
MADISLAWPEILAGLARGDLVRDTLARHGVTEKEKRGYLANNPEARRQWDEAREASADAFNDEALAVARGEDNPRGMSNTGSAEPGTRIRDPQMARLHVDTLKWAARIRNPRLYGDKAQLDVNVRTVDLTAIIRDANARLAQSTRGRLIEHESMLPRLGLDGGARGGTPQDLGAGTVDAVIAAEAAKLF